MDSPNFIQSDHDLLIQIAVKIESLIASMNKLEQSMSGKADQREVAELRDKVHELEAQVEQQVERQASRWGQLVGIAIGAGSVGSVASFVLKILFGH